MRPFILTVEGQRFIVDENGEGQPQIRREDAAIVTRDDSVTVVVAYSGLDVPVRVDVER